MKYLLAIVVCSLFSLTAIAQNTRNGSSSSETGNSEVFMRERQNMRIFARRVRAAPTRNAFAEARIKERQKMAEEMKKPQYSDKMYFGHKRPPKKRPVHKRKFCKECGIVH
jgi:hypothetical protein